MRVAYVSSSWSQHNLKFFKHLIAMGVQVHWITLDEPAARLVDMDVFKSLRELSVYEFGSSDDHGTHHHSPAKNKISRSIEFAKQLRFLKRCLKRIKPDILHGNFVQNDGLLSALSGFSPFLEAVWGSDVLVNPRLSVRDLYALKYVARKADAIYCDCQTVKDAILGMCRVPANDIHVFPQLGIDTSLFSPEVTHESVNIKNRWRNRKLLVMTRWLASIYGIDVFVKAIPIISAHEDVHVLFIGSGPEADSYHELSSRLGITDRVSFLGDIPNQELRHYLCAADLYVSSSYSDGTSLSLLEAMACGKPVVVSDVPANLEWIRNGENGLIFPRGNHVDLAKCVIELLKDDMRRSTMGNMNVSIVADRADIERNAGRLINLYDKLLLRHKVFVV